MVRLLEQGMTCSIAAPQVAPAHSLRAAAPAPDEATTLGPPVVVNLNMGQRATNWPIISNASQLQARAFACVRPTNSNPPELAGNSLQSRRQQFHAWSIGQQLDVADSTALLANALMLATTMHSTHCPSSHPLAHHCSGRVAACRPQRSSLHQIWLAPGQPGLSLPPHQRWQSPPLWQRPVWQLPGCAGRRPGRSSQLPCIC